MPASVWIDSPAKLEPYAATLQKGPWLAIDTEADSLHHYKESVCLLTVLQEGQDPDRTGLIDPIAFTGLAPFWEIAAASPWILHGADFDLRLMRRIGAPEPPEVFDTMLGAQLCGLTGIGYAGLVDQFFGVKLDKASQKEDWSARPLTPKMLDYAAQDVTYLHGIRERLAAKLAEQGRTEWHREASARVVRTSRVLRETDPEETWRIVGWNKLDYSALPILKELWRWRDGEAREKDVPTFKILSNDRLLEMSAWVDSNRNADQVPGFMLPSNCRGGRLLRLQDALHRGRMEQPLPPPPPEKRPKKDPAFDRRVDAIKKGRDALAADLHLDPSLIASRAILFALAADGPAALSTLVAENRWCAWQAEMLRPVVEAQAG